VGYTEILQEKREIAQQQGDKFCSHTIGKKEKGRAGTLICGNPLEKHTIKKSGRERTITPNRSATNYKTPKVFGLKKNSTQKR